MSSADERLLQALAALGEALGELTAPSMIIGGLAVIAHGVARHTVDIDATVWAEGLDLDELLGALGKHAIVPRMADAREFARQTQVLLLRHEPSGTPLELSLAWLPFEREALEQATEVDFGGVSCRVARPADLVVYKAIAWRERDRADIDRLLRLHPGLPLDAVRRQIAQFAEALDEPERLREFDALVARSRRPR